jgi:hypothetical protein
MRSPRRAAPPLLLALALLAGCGGSSHTLGGPSLLAQANAICQAHATPISRAIDTIIHAGGGRPGDANFARVITGTVVPQYRAELRALRRLRPPGAAQDVWSDWLEELTHQVRALARPPASTAPGRAATPRNRGAAAIGRPFWTRANAAAQTLGLSSACQGGV